MKYLCLIYSDEKGAEIPGVNDWDTLMKEHNAFGAEAGAAGVVVGGEALQDTSTATTIRDKDGSEVITDGPFAETKEQLGGFYMLEAANLDEALKWAAKIPHPGGCIEVRPVIDFG
ncbi:MAG TPA: YciI family protein [Acidimicrobiales bacterium]|nr:YciI family protein [Acidimicrobiales bacterium]